MWCDLDYRNYLESADRLNETFVSAVPFPYVVIDQFMPESVARRAEAAFPSPNDKIWKQPKNIATVGKSVTKQGEFRLKELTYNAEQRELITQLNSAAALDYFACLTGIAGLIGDPYLAESGFHRMSRGACLAPHADFSHHDKLGLQRRLNLIWYIGSDYRPEWGGTLDLYDANMNSVHNIAPLHNRAVIFQTSQTSFHGVSAVDCPDHTFRKSIAMYYYTLPVDDYEPHRIIFPEFPELTVIPTVE